MTDTLIDELSLEGVARYIQSEKCKRIFVMTGAGISTSAGIPDFRSPDTGLYANLARLKLPYPEAVFDIRYFRRNPLPFYVLAHELAPGRFRPTLTHSFIRLLHEKKLLHTCFTQNIDTLERRAGLPDHKIVEAHGSFATHRCIDCKNPFPDDQMKDKIQKKEVPKCNKCNGLVKPEIVFFGESLPPLFHRSITNIPTADLLIVIGTSLTVHPFAALPELVPNTCPRVLINLEEAGDIGSREADIVVLGKCDEIVRDLSKLLGWEQDLNDLWEATKDTVEPEDTGDRVQPVRSAEKEVRDLAEEVGKSLKLTPPSGSEEAKSETTTEQVDEPTTAENKEIDRVEEDESKSKETPLSKTQL